MSSTINNNDLLSIHTSILYDGDDDGDDDDDDDDEL